MQRHISADEIKRQMMKLEFTTPFKNEERCRFVIETLTGRSFPSARPSWLMNPLSRRCLELDCYNEELKLAIEYNGIQHYRSVGFNADKMKFRDQVYRDRLKALLCQKNGVRLIVVPHTIKGTDIVDFIIDMIDSYLL